MILYHGSEKPIKNFNPGIVFLTDDKDEALEYSLGVHTLDTDRDVSYLLTVEANVKNVKNVSNIIEAFVMDEEHPYIDDDDITLDLDTWIDNKLSPDMRKKGYNFLIFEHPPLVKNDELEVYISLYPNRDLKIVNVESVL